MPNSYAYIVDLYVWFAQIKNYASNTSKRDANSNVEEDHAQNEDEKHKVVTKEGINHLEAKDQKEIDYVPIIVASIIAISDPYASYD